MKIYRRPYRVKKRRSIFKNQFFWLAILILIFFAEIFYLICLSSFFQIKEIEISGNQKVATKSLEKIIRGKINQKILFLDSKSIFLINFNEIKEEILKDFLQAKEVRLKRKFPKTISLEIEERKPVAIFCQENCFFIDNEGIIFEKVLEFAPKMIEIKNLTLERELKLNERVVEKEKISQILEIESNLKENLKLLIEEAKIVSDQRLDIKTSENWEIYFNLKGDLNWQITKLDLVLKEKISPEERKNLKYIDLRFEKVYFFLKRPI